MKKSLFLVIALMHIVFSSFAMDTVSVSLAGEALKNAGIHEMYKELVSLVANQKGFFPFRNKESIIAQQSAATGFFAKQDVFQKLIFNPASGIGMIVQYKKLLAEGLPGIKSLFDPLQLVVTAYMQHEYGGGKPFDYNGQFDKEADENNPILGSYNSPKGNITMTRYSLVNALLGEAEKLVKDPLMMQVGKTAETIAMLRRNLAAAIEFVDVIDMAQGTEEFTPTINEAESILFKGNSEKFSEWYRMVVETGRAKELRAIER